MLKNYLYYFVGLFVVGGLLSLGVSMLLSLLPYLTTIVVILLPIYGTIRQTKNWKKESLGVKSWIKTFLKIFKFGKPNLTFYLILGIIIGLTYEEMAFMILRTFMYALGGSIMMYLLWETIIRTLKKGLPSFSEAVKQSL